MSIVQPDFSKIFASGAAIGELLNWPDENYLRGWGYLKESEPPPMEFFNALANLSDTKDNYLFQAINIRKNKTQYHIDDIATTPNLTSKYQLICIQEGVTAEAEPTWPDTDGEEVLDGACKWRVTSKVANGITIAEDEPINARDYSVWLALNANNDIAKLKYKTAQKTWKQLLIESKLSAILDSPVRSLERNTIYKKNDILSDATLPGGFLVCETAGTSGASIPSAITNAVEGENITDGTAIFSVHYFYNLASLISPAFSGTPTAPTATKGTNTKQIATMAAIINALADYAKKESPVLTGEPKAPTAEKGTGGDIIATCAYVLAALEGIDLSDYAKTTDLDEYAKKVSPALSGTPTAPTAAKTVNNTQIATTAFVHLLAGAANNGGIVDSLLAQNGYVKFANGLILQWGFTVFDPVYYKNVNFTLPLSVNGTFCAFSTGYDAKGSTFLWHSMSHFNNVNVGVTGFVFDSRYTFTGLGYLAVCW